MDIGEDSLLNGFLSTKWRDMVNGMTGKSKSSTWLTRLTTKIYELGGAVWGKRNALTGLADGSDYSISLQEVMVEVERGSVGNQRVAELLQEGSRPTDTSPLHYIRMWLASVKVARAVHLPQEDRESRGREIMYRWLRGGNERRR